MPDAAAPGARPARPFPGLRVFTEDEAHLFFGREGQSDTIIRLLERDGFVAVVGTSGCGKSSILGAGVRPSLLAGYAVSVGSSWQIVDCRPGIDPMSNLAAPLGRRLGRSDTGSAWLRHGSSSIVTAVREAREAGALDPDDNVLILIDQFEELFRYRARKESLTADRDEKAEFVALLLRAIQNRSDRIFVALTMRSDFLGDCAQFRDLPEVINRGQYLVPRMTRQQRQLAIEGPVRVAGAAIAPRLVQRLLNELGDDEDQLPVLQHALMRTWDAWVLRGQREAIDFTDYEAIGSLRSALGNHAEEALADVRLVLGERGESIVKQIFQRLRIRDANGRETRSPAFVRDLTAITGASVADVSTALDAFRDDDRGRTFIVPLKSALPVLDTETRIDVMHESLIRCWPSLSNEWVPEEEDARRRYTMLAAQAEEEGQPPQNFLGGARLQRIAEWWDERKPNAVWAARYHAGFAAAAAYLAASRQELARTQQKADDDRRADEARKIEDARRDAELRETRLRTQVAYAGAILSLIALGFGIYYYLGSRRATTEAMQAREAAVVELASTKSESALAAREKGSIVPSLLLAAEALRQSPSSRAQALLSSALSFVPPAASWPVTKALAVAFGNEGQLLAALGEDQVLHLWNADAKTPTKDVGVDVQGFAVARSAERAVTTGGNGRMAVWDTATVAKLAEFPCADPTGPPRMSDDGSVVATLCGGQPIAWIAKKEWSRAAPLRVGTGSSPSTRWTQMALDSDGGFVALASVGAGRAAVADELDLSPSRSIEVRALASGRVVAEQSIPDNPTAIELLGGRLSDAPVLAIGDAGGRIRLWRIEGRGKIDLDGANPSSTLNIPGAVTTLARGLDPTTLIAGSRRGNASVWVDGEAVAFFNGDASLVSASVVSADGVAAIVDRQHRVQWFDLGAMEDELRVPRGVLSAQFTPDGSLLTYRERAVGAISKVLNLSARKLVQTLDMRRDRFYAVAIAPDKRSIAVRLTPQSDAIARLSLRAYGDGQIGADRWTRPVPIDGTLGVPTFSSDGQHLAGFVRRTPSPRGDGPGHRLGLFVWSAATGAEELYRAAENPRSVRAPAFCFAGKEPRMVLASRDGIREIAVPGGKESDSRLKASGTVMFLSCSPDGTRVAVAESGGDAAPDGDDVSAHKVRLFEYPSGREIRAVDHQGLVRSMSFDLTARFLTIVGSDSVSLWDLSRPDRPLQYPVRHRPIAAMLTQQGQLAVANERGVSYLRWRPEDLIREACHRAGRDLTPAEWGLYMGNEPRPSTCAQIGGDVARRRE